MREIFALVDQVHARTRLAMFDREIFNFNLSDVNTKNLVERGYKTYKWSDFLNTQIEKKKRFSCQWSSWGKELNLWTLMALQTRKTRIRLQTQMEFDAKNGTQHRQPKNEKILHWFEIQIWKVSAFLVLNRVKKTKYKEIIDQSGFEKSWDWV